MARRSRNTARGPQPLSEAASAAQPADRMVDGVPVRTYRGASLGELAPRIRAELGDDAMILRQREGVTGGIGGFFAKRMVEIDVAVVPTGFGRGGRAGGIDVSDGPAVGPGAPTAPAPAAAPEPHAFQPLAPPPVPPGARVQHTEAFPMIEDDLGEPPASPMSRPVDPFEPVPAVAPQPSAPAGYGAPFHVTAPSIAEAQGVETMLRAEQERAREIHESTHDASIEAPFDPGQVGAAPVAVPQGGMNFEERLRQAGLADPTGPPDPAHVLGPLHQALVRRGLPEQIASPIADDVLVHRVALEPDADIADLLAAELARRIPTAPLVGRAGQAVAFVGSSGIGKTRAIARLAAAYGAAGKLPVACVTLQDSGYDGLLASALAPFGVAVHSAPDAPRALDRVTALRRHSLVLVDTPGVSPGDRASVERLGATLQLLELDTIALCLPVTLAAPIARRVLRALRPLRPNALVATHADEADLLGGVVAVAIDRRVPLAYVSGGAGRGTIVGADASRIARDLLADASHLPPAPEPTSSGRTVPVPEIRRPLAPDPADRLATPTVDVAAGAAHLAPPWVSPSLRDRRR